MHSCCTPIAICVLVGMIGFAVGNKGITDIFLGREEVEDKYTITGAFDPKAQKCCRGVLHPSPKRDLDKCCGTELFDITKQLCCKGVIHEYSTASACCGQEAYDTDQALCCEGVVVPVDPDAKATSKCCGSKVADSRNSACCPSEKGMVVVDNANGQKTYCCDDKTYDLATEVCSAEMTNDRQITFMVLPKDGDKTMSCGNQLYDDETESCCGFKIVPANVSCCGGQTLKETEICCWNDDNTFSPKVPPSPKHACCGSTGFYNPETQLCCGHTVFENPGKGEQCCGEDKTYNPSVDLCCPQMGGSYDVVHKTDPQQNSCCGQTPYHIATELCCDMGTGKAVKKLTPQADTCCGDIAYRYSEGICCSDKYFAGPWYMMRCCNGEGFNTSEALCCGGKLQTSQPGEQCCADSEVYNSTTHRCCIDYLEKPHSFAVVEMEHELQSCCGLKLYDASVGVCCGNEIIPHSSGKSCCSRQQFDVNSQLCCGMSILPKKDTETACCYSFTTDEDGGNGPSWGSNSPGWGA